MNKSGFINELQSKTEYTQEQCVIINDVLESHFILRKKNKPNVVADLMEKLSIDEAQADSLYEQAMEIIHTQIRSAKRRPLGDPSKR